MFVVNLTCIFLRHLDMALKQPLNVHIKTHSLWMAPLLLIIWQCFQVYDLKI